MPMLNRRRAAAAFVFVALSAPVTAQLAGEVFIHDPSTVTESDGRWYTFDARNNTPRIGRVLIARGRDAADVAIATTFGPNTLQSFLVRSDEVIES